MARKYFGTDGIRGRVGEGISTRSSCSSWLGGRACAGQWRGQQGPDRQGHAYLGVYVRGRAGRPGWLRPAWISECWARCRRRRSPIRPAPPACECRDRYQRIAQSARGQRHRSFRPAATSCRTRSRKQIEDELGKPMTTVARAAWASQAAGRCARALYRVLQEHHSVQAGLSWSEGGGRLRTWCDPPQPQTCSKRSVPRSSPSAPNRMAWNINEGFWCDQATCLGQFGARERCPSRHRPRWRR